jgi:phosphoribosylformylglycinamidine synthase subunit PurS
MKATVLVRPKEGILDPQGQAVGDSLRKLGFHVAGARVGRLVELDLAAAHAAEARDQVERMCRELLANPLIESYEIVLPPPEGSEGNGEGLPRHPAIRDEGD